MKKKVSIKFKFLLTSAVLIFALVTLISVIIYKNFESDLIAMGVEEAAVSAKVAAYEVDADIIGKVIADKASAAEIEKIRDELAGVRHTCGVAYIYALYTDGQNVYYCVDGSEEPDEKGAVFEDTYAELEEAFQGKTYVQNEIDYTEDGALITAYEPVFNSDGKQIAIVGGDFDAQEIVDRMTATKRTIIMVALIGTVLALICLNFIVSLTTRSIATVNKKIYELVHSEGDLRNKIEVKSGDEMEEMADNVNALLEYIRKIMVSISGGSNNLNLSSRNVSQNINMASDSISDVSATMEEMSAAMQETTASLLQINTSIEDAYNRISEISAAAAEGNDMTMSISRKAQSIYSDAEKARKDARTLTDEITEKVNEKIEASKRVEEISVLSDNILNITEETSLLALNASIEAARAGETGRGFAVVATQISKLASDSAKTTEQIQAVSTEVIDAVHGLADEAGKMIRFIEDKAMEGYERLLSTSSDYERDARTIQGSMEDFARESQAIDDAMNVVKEALEAVGVAVEESAKGVVNVSETSADLSESLKSIGNEADANLGIAGSLNDEVGKFKI